MHACPVCLPHLPVNVAARLCHKGYNRIRADRVTSITATNTALVNPRPFREAGASV